MIDILIVEDNIEIATLLSDFLRKENYVVSIADTGEKALELYETYGAKLVLLDIMLPAMESKKSRESKKEKMERSKALMRKLGIIEVADNDINEVSGGQLQRACICRSMINRPRVLFADEPTGALNRTASRCSRTLYIVDGNIKGEYTSPSGTDIQARDRERQLNNWLMELGW